MKRKQDALKSIYQNMMKLPTFMLKGTLPIKTEC